MALHQEDSPKRLGWTTPATEQRLGTPQLVGGVVLEGSLSNGVLVGCRKRDPRQSVDRVEMAIRREQIGANLHRVGVEARAHSKGTASADATA